MRSCPRCTYPLDAFTHQGAEVDLCRRCGGLFLDSGDAARTFGPETEPAAWLTGEGTRRLGPAGLSCPRDQEELHAFRVSWGGRGVVVDVCPRCRGLWLDKDEGHELRRLVRGAQSMRTVPPGSAVLHSPEQHERMRQQNLEAANEEAPPPGLGSYLFQLFTGLPIEVYNPVPRAPHTVYLLVAGLVLVFGAQLAVPGLTEALYLVPGQIGRGRGMVALFTSTLLHGGVAHLLGNLYFLWVFGDNVEDKLGSARFFMLYALSALGASGLHVLTHLGASTPVLGASGAVAGLMGAYFVLFPRVKLWIVLFFVRFRIGAWWYLGLWAGYQFLMGLMNQPRIAWYAHFGGFLVGALVARRFR